MTLTGKRIIKIDMDLKPNYEEAIEVLIPRNLRIRRKKLFSKALSVY